MYFPKSKIAENQYTDGTEYQRKDNGQPYTGKYCKLSDGRFFSGKTLTNTSIELVKIEKNDTLSFLRSPALRSIIQKSQSLLNLNKKKELKASVIKPTPSDYQRGFLIRYFAKKLSASPIQIFEINSQDHNDVITHSDKYLSLYQTTVFSWKITGPDHDMSTNTTMPVYGIIDTNKRTLDQKEKEMAGITQYFENRLKEFAK